MNTISGNGTAHICPLQNVDTINVLSLPHSEYYKRFLIAFICINALAAVLSTSFNFTVIYTILRRESLRTPSNILILGLAVSDFVNGFVVQPSYCFVRFAELRRDFSLFCSAGMVYNLSVWSLTASSLLTLTLITADRFLAVHLHLRYQELVTTKRYGMVLILAWISSSTVSFGRLSPVTTTGLLVFTAISLVALLVMNGFFIFKISRVIRRHSLQIQAQQQSVQQSIDMPRYKKSVNTMYLVICAFILFYVPFLGTLVTVLSVSDQTQEIRYMLVISITLLFFNGMLNPVIYCWRIREIRNEIYRLLNLQRT